MTMNSKNTYWDGFRLIDAVVELAVKGAISKASDAWDNRVLQLRLYSALVAIYELEYDEQSSMSVIQDFYNGKFCNLKRSRHALGDEIYDILFSYTNMERNQVSELLEDEEEHSRLFVQLIRKRVDMERAMDGRSLQLEGTKVQAFGHRILQRIYEPLEKCNSELNEILVILLNLDGRKSFDELTLKEQYHYPTATDAELSDWFFDNL